MSMSGDRNNSFHTPPQVPRNILSTLRETPRDEKDTLIAEGVLDSEFYDEEVTSKEPAPLSSEDRYQLTMQSVCVCMKEGRFEDARNALITVHPNYRSPLWNTKFTIAEEVLTEKRKEDYKKKKNKIDKLISDYKYSEAEAILETITHPDEQKRNSFILARKAILHAKQSREEKRASVDEKEFALDPSNNPANTAPNLHHMLNLRDLDDNKAFEEMLGRELIDKQRFKESIITDYKMEHMEEKGPNGTITVNNNINYNENIYYDLVFASMLFGLCRIEYMNSLPLYLLAFLSALLGVASALMIPEFTDKSIQGMQELVYVFAAWTFSDALTNAFRYTIDPPSFGVQFGLASRASKMALFEVFHFLFNQPWQTAKSEIIRDIDDILENLFKVVLLSAIPSGTIFYNNFAPVWPIVPTILGTLGRNISAFFINYVFYSAQTRGDKHYLPIEEIYFLDLNIKRIKSLMRDDRNKLMRYVSRTKIIPSLRHWRDKKTPMEKTQEARIIWLKLLTLFPDIAVRNIHKTKPKEYVDLYTRFCQFFAKLAHNCYLLPKHIYQFLAELAYNGYLIPIKAYQSEYNHYFTKQYLQYLFSIQFLKNNDLRILSYTTGLMACINLQSAYSAVPQAWSLPHPSDIIDAFPQLATGSLNMILAILLVETLIAIASWIANKRINFSTLVKLFESIGTMLQLGWRYKFNNSVTRLIVTLWSGFLYCLAQSGQIIMFPIITLLKIPLFLAGIPVNFGISFFAFDGALKEIYDGYYYLIFGRRAFESEDLYDYYQNRLGECTTRLERFVNFLSEIATILHLDVFSLAILKFLHLAPPMNLPETLSKELYLANATAEILINFMEALKVWINSRTPAELELWRRAIFTNDMQHRLVTPLEIPEARRLLADGKNLGTPRTTADINRAINEVPDDSPPRPSPFPQLMNEALPTTSKAISSSPLTQSPQITGHRSSTVHGLFGPMSTYMESTLSLRAATLSPFEIRVVVDPSLDPSSLAASPNDDRKEEKEGKGEEAKTPGAFNRAS